MCKDMEMMCSRFAGGHSHALVPSISLSAGIIYISPESSQPPPAVPCSAIPAGPPTTQEVATVEEKEKKDDDDDDDNEDDEPVVAGNTIRTGENNYCFLCVKTFSELSLFLLCGCMRMWKIECAYLFDERRVLARRKLVCCVSSSKWNVCTPVEHHIRHRGVEIDNCS